MNRAQCIISLFSEVLDPQIVSHVPSTARRLNTIGMDKSDALTALTRPLPKERDRLDYLPHAKEFKFSTGTHTYSKVDPYLRAQHDKSYADVAQANKEREDEFYRDREARRSLRYEPVSVREIKKDKSSFVSSIIDKFRK